MEFVGVYGGLLCGILGWFFGRQQLRKKKGLDEMYYYVWGKAKSISWYFTVVALYILMSLVLFEIEIGTLPILAILLFVHLGSWAISGFILSAKLTEPNLTIKNPKVMSTIICVTLLVSFTILSLVTSNWKL